MKKILIYVISFLASASIALAEGIGSASDLVAYINACNSGSGVEEWISQDGVVRLTADIDLSKQKKMPHLVSFGGIMDGCGHSIKGWKTAEPLFESIGEGAKVTNLTFESDCNLKPSDKNPSQNFGFLTGENNGSVLNCINKGSIVYKSGYLEVQLSLGGLVGKNNYVVFGCVNYGNIKVDVCSAQHIKELPLNVGGVVGANGDRSKEKSFVASCYNFGDVSVSCDTPAQSIGGIIGSGFKRTTKYCVNKGNISCYSPAGAQAKDLAQSRVGGIIGFTKGDVMCCDNFGTVSTNGASAGCVGGIVGQPHAALVVGDCVNYGAISSSNTGGDNCGGIAGNVGRPVHFKRCLNRGPARQGIVGHLYKPKTVTDDTVIKDCVDMSGGRMASMPGLAKADKPLENGANVYGQVVDNSGKPIIGVVVSDGFNSVCTGADGVYMMKSNLDMTHFVQISLPSEYEVPSVNGIPSFFKRVPRYCEAVRADFILTPRQNPSDKYTLAMIADPQVRPTGKDGSMETWRDDVSTDVEKFRSGVKGDLYCINLGDLVYNFPYAFDDYLQAASSINAPTFNVIGNHDYDQQTLMLSELGQVYFETYVGPVNYSFNIGKLHFLVMNSIMYDIPLEGGQYKTGLDDNTLTWLKNDLKYIPTDRTLIVCTHAQLFKKSNDPKSPVASFGGRNRNFKEYKNLILPYKRVYSWSGHYHRNYFCEYSSHPEFEERFRADNLTCVCVARCTGALRFNKYIGSDGTPQGYMVVNVDGENLDWSYKSVGKDMSWQMKIYPPSRSEDGCLRTIIWNWNEDWTMPELWQGGKKIGVLESAPQLDPDYVELFSQLTNETTKKYCRPSNAQMFRFDKKDLKGEYEVRVRDNFGKEYSEKISL